MELSRFEGNFAAVGDAQLGAGGWLALIHASLPKHDPHEAIACYLSSAEGWDEALKVLRGAFASDAAQAVRASAIKQNEHGINQRASEYLQRPGLKPIGNDNV